MVGIQSFDSGGLSHKSGELTVEGDEVSSLDLLQNQVDVVLEVCWVNLHTYN